MLLMLNIPKWFTLLDLYFTIQSNSATLGAYINRKGDVMKNY